MAEGIAFASAASFSIAARSMGFTRISGLAFGQQAGSSSSSSSSIANIAANRWSASTTPRSTSCAILRRSPQGPAFS